MVRISVCCGVVALLLQAGDPVSTAGDRIAARRLKEKVGEEGQRLRL